MPHGALALLLLLLASCGSMTPSVAFLPLGDLETTTPRTYAERGHGTAVTPPGGVRWTLALDGYEESAFTTLPERRFEVRLTLTETDARRPARFAPAIDSAELVDDSGRRVACHQVVLPEESDDPNAPPPATRAYTFVFELPPGYRFQSINHATVHWVLSTPDGPLAISSRFRR